MKKFFALFCVCLSLLLSQTTPSLSMFSKKFFGTHTFFSSQQIENEETSVTKNGNGFLICCNTKLSNQIFCVLDKSKIFGESFCFENKNFDEKLFLRKCNAKIVKIEKTLDIYITYAYSKKFSKFVFAFGQKVNLQIAQNKNIITIGTPLILGGF